MTRSLAAVALVAGCAGSRPITVGTDKGYGTSDFVMELRELGRGSSRSRVVLDRIVDAEAHEPAEQQVEVEPLHQLTLQAGRSLGSMAVA
jgi:hypothetical protein